MPVEGYKAAVIVKELDSHEAAVSESENMKNCPFVLMYGVEGKTTTSVFMVPDEYSWWLNYSEMFPESRSQTFKIQEIYYPQNPQEITPSEKPPCGADCNECPQREEYKCLGCAGTRIG